MASNAKKIFVIMVSVFLVNITILTLLPSVYANDWPMFQHDLKHVGYSTSTAPNTNNIIWNYTTDGDVYSSPAVVDGKVYIGSDDGHMYCLDAEDGDELWNSSIIGTLWSSSPAVDDGRVYIGGNSFFCFNAENGSLVWNYPSSRVSSSPAIVDDRVYVGSWDNNVYCLDADPDDNGDGIINHNPYDEIEDDNDEGYNDSFTVDYDLIWMYETGNLVVASPAIHEGKVFIGSQDKKIYCLPQEDPNGDGIINNTEEIWNFTTLDIVQSSPTYVDGKIYVGSNDNKVYCLYANSGREDWSYTTTGDVKCSPAYYNGKIYACSLGYTGRVYCLDVTTGLPAWDDPFQAGGGITSSPAIADGKIYVGSIDNKVYCLDIDDGTKIWEYETGSFIDYSSPAIADGRLYIGSRDNTIYCFGDEGNQPPSKPSKPSGITSGSIGTEYSYSTSTTDPEEDQLYYLFDWGDSENSGWLGPYSSGEMISASHTWSTANDYEVKVKAKDIHNSESLWSSVLTVTISEQLPEKELAIGVSSSVIEGDEFTVTITEEASGNAVLDADVIFNGDTIQTDENGQVTFTAPFVDGDTGYTIIANEEDYQSDITTITVLNERVDESWGFIYGIVSNESSLLENAQITITSGDKSWITYTNEDGQYVQAVPPDIYTVEASKQGYETIVRGGITVEENEAMEANFKLVESTVSIEERESMAEYIVQIKIENGSVGAEIDATSTEHHVTLYSDLDIDVSKSNPLSKGNISFSVTGEGPGTIIVIYVTGVENENNVVLTYDGIDIRKTTDISGFFSSENTEESWIMLLGEKGEYVVLLNIPEWSEHSITISSLVSALGGPIVAVLYISISTIVLIVFLSPMITNIIRRRMHFRKKK